MLSVRAVTGRWVLTVCAFLMLYWSVANFVVHRSMQACAQLISFAVLFPYGVSRWDSGLTVEAVIPLLQKNTSALFSYHNTDADVDLTSGSCLALQWAVMHFGVYGAVTKVPMKYWHKLSQMIGSIAMQANETPSLLFQNLDLLARVARREKMTANSLGIAHGAVWLFVGTMPGVLTWALLLETLCPTFSDAFLHGLGHGLMIRFSGANFSACSSMPIVRKEGVLYEAVAFCERAPYPYVKMFCSAGAFHGFQEYSHFPAWEHPMIDNNWMRPCQDINLSATCFLWVFFSGTFQHAGVVGPTARAFAILQHNGHISSICLRTPMHEANVRGCIWGLSASNFLLYHEGWVASMRDSSSPLSACKKVNGIGVTGLAVNCHLVFKSSDAVASRLTRSSLIDWCSFFCYSTAHNGPDSLEALDQLCAWVRVSVSRFHS